jgi:hypothetical protein
MEIFALDSFETSNIPEWSCPTCSRGILQISGNLSLEDNANTIRFRSDENFEPEYAEFHVQGMFKCNRQRCSETVMMVGTGTCELEQDVIEGEWSQYLANFFKPKFFQPHLNIFDVPDYAPSEIANMLKLSFAVFFCDSDSCGNRIRASVEIVLNHIGSPSTKTTRGGKIKSISLGDRINALTEEHDNIKELLSAIRIIGNEGSHSESSLSRQDTIDSYTMVQFILELIFKPEVNTAEIYELARQRIDENEARQQVVPVPVPV